MNKLMFIKAAKDILAVGAIATVSTIAFIKYVKHYEKTHRDQSKN